MIADLDDHHVLARRICCVDQLKSTRHHCFFCCWEDDFAFVVVVDFAAVEIDGGHELDVDMDYIHQSNRNNLPHHIVSCGEDLVVMTEAGYLVPFPCSRFETSVG